MRRTIMRSKLFAHKLSAYNPCSSRKHVSAYHTAIAAWGNVFHVLLLGVFR